ncbi:hypothetical protein CPAST_c10880 [Clostridium pasteurianum DSM 525 = ATCC 6013]|uniref:Uncharacterized protein n=1 Tax=Clostridium pasteurianum DSM 525 = ATCC 6013 TaxID=1262449 RepID=A0A0H3J5L1_CLOPA|nr:hypothetical protein [Clostridium pasteurianum]AJA47188.1 hypothetical protein CPAST_c10880 [Clostridium pasteurianum DSM 525 = ATCC 6013]AJA51176.1 hypothetical protein CLPA_c10880 [Clostridium pasteurianum DSM 525 = ATCC 6013]KRU12816.1 hypothetical protein CP6013_02064 [Clostridium pasteurianum DSM 525 = ATCC 6013]UZW15351.1 hypothetical protein OSC52_05800 [Clostridium pasteurianum]
MFKNIINKLKLWKYERDGEFYIKITGKQSEYYNNLIKELKANMYKANSGKVA